MSSALEPRKLTDEGDRDPEMPRSSHNNDEVSNPDPVPNVPFEAEPELGSPETEIIVYTETEAVAEGKSGEEIGAIAILESAAEALKQSHLSSDNLELQICPPNVETETVETECHGLKEPGSQGNVPSELPSNSLSQDHRPLPVATITPSSILYFGKPNETDHATMTMTPCSTATASSAAVEASTVVGSNENDMIKINWGNVTEGSNGQQYFSYNGVHYVSVLNQEQDEVVISNAEANTVETDEPPKQPEKGKKVYLCMEEPKCNASFSLLRSLKNHIKTCHGTYVCTICKFVGDSAKVLVRHGIFAHSKILIQEIDPTQNVARKMVFLCFWSDCDWKAESEKLLTHHVLNEHLGILIGSNNRSYLKKYKYSLQNGDRFMFWNWKMCNQKTLPFQVKSSYEAIADACVVPNPLSAPELEFDETKIDESLDAESPSTLDTPIPSSTSTSVAADLKQSPPPLSTPPFDDTCRPAAVIHFSSLLRNENGQIFAKVVDEPHNQIVLSYQVERRIEPEPNLPLKSPTIFHCAHCDMQSDVPREVALHEVRFHCERRGLPKTCTIMCHVCEWMSSSEESLVLHILSCHRQIPLSAWEQRELKDADYIYAIFFRDVSEPVPVKIENSNDSSPSHQETCAKQATNPEPKTSPDVATSGKKLEPPKVKKKSHPKPKQSKKRKNKSNNDTKPKKQCVRTTEDSAIETTRDMIIVTAQKVVNESNKK